MIQTLLVWLTFIKCFSSEQSAFYTAYKPRDYSTSSHPQISFLLGGKDFFSPRGWGLGSGRCRGWIVGGGLDLLGVLGVRLRAHARVGILATSIFIQISRPKLLQTS